LRLSWNRRNFLKSALLAAGGLSSLNFQHALAEEAVPDNWISFRNGTANLGISHTRLPAALRLQWSHVTPDGTASTAVIDSGNVYMGTLSGDLHCFELKTGTLTWTYRSIDKVEPNSFAPGFNAAAALDARHIYLGDDQGTLHAVDRASGKKVWTVETDGEIVGGAQLFENRVLFGSHDGHLYCHDAESGKQIWRAETHGPVNATPCLAGKFTFTTGCDQPILRVFELESGRQEAEVPLRSLLIGAAAVREEILYFGTGEGIVLALDWRNKKTLWEFSVPGREQQMQSSPAVTADCVIIGSRDKRVYCLERQTGQLRWEFATRGKVDSSPVVVGDDVYFGSSDRNIYGVKIADGQQIWKQPVKQSITGSPAIAAGCLVIGTESANGQILCFGE